VICGPATTSFFLAEFRSCFPAALPKQTGVACRLLFDDPADPNQRGGRQLPIHDPNRHALLRGLLILSIVGVPTGAALAGGENAAPFLGIDVGARALGVAGAYAPLADDETCIYWNPAGLGLIDGPELGAMHTAWYQNLEFEWAGGATPVGARGGVGFAAALLHTPPIQGYDDTGQPTGDFDARDMAVTIAGGLSLSDAVAVGVSVKGIQQTMAGETATGFAGDVGLLADVWGWRFGATARNLGPELRFGGDAYPLPFGMTAGVARLIGGGGLVGAAVAGGPEPEARVGAEWTWNGLFALRAGYRAGLDGNDPSSGVTAGFGLRRSAWSVDYAMTPHQDLGAAHRLSLSLRFGGARDAADRRVCGTESRGTRDLAGAPAAAAPSGEFRLCTVARHSSLESARAEVRSLDLIGVKGAHIVPEDGVYRVVVAFFRSRGGAEARAEELAATGFQTEVTEP
jgi:hypothetical protein